jgi:CRISPR-associated endonuclease Csn1
MERNDILFTRQCFQKKGAISDQTIVRHGTNNDVLPIKSSDKRLCKIEKYGGYNKTGKAYFFLVEHTAKGKRIKTFSDVPIWLVSQIDSGKMSLQQYCTETLGLKDPVIILPKILINTKIRYKGFIYEISGASGNKIALKTAVPLILDSNSYEYSYYLEKYLTYIKPIETKKDKMTPENKKLLELKAYQYRLSPERNIELYHTLLSKCTNAIYKNKVTVSNKLFLEKNLSEFVSSNIVTQANLLEQLLLLFSCRQGTIDLSLIGGLKAIESSKINRNLQDSITFIYQSATGIYEKRTEIKVP